MNFESFTGPGSTPARRRFWEKARAAVLASQKIAGKNITVTEHPGQGTVLKAKRDRGAAASCRPSSPSSFQIRWIAVDNYGFVPGIDITRDYTLDNMPWCNDFDSYPCSPVDSAPAWNRSFSPEWYDYWYGDHGPNDDAGDWCEADGIGPWEVHVVAEEPACVFTTVNLKVWPRFGTVNGDTGWHMLMRGSADNSNTCGPGTCPSDYFPLFDESPKNFYLGPTLNGTISGLTRSTLCYPGSWPERWTFTLEFSS